MGDESDGFCFKMEDRGGEGTTEWEEKIDEMDGGNRWDGRI